MKYADLPELIPGRWAATATSPYVNPIPFGPSDPGRASFTEGFPPLNFTAVSNGGIPPYGADMNGILQQVTADVQWLQAGGPVVYNSVFSALIGGYPRGAVVQSATAVGRFWQSTVDDNVTDPDAGGAGWVTWPNGTFYAVDTGSANAGSIALDLPVDDTDKLLGTFIVVEKTAAANTGGYTLQVNGTSGSLGVFNVLNPNGNGVLPNQLQASSHFVVTWVGTNFKLVAASPSLSASAAGDTSDAMVGVLPPGNAPVQILAVYPTPGLFSFNVPEERYSLYGICTGGGGGGAGENTGGPFSGGGGGAGGTSMGWFATTPGASIAVTVGTGGTGGISGSTGSSQGLNGGSSSIGAFMSATGGNAGESGADAAGGQGGLGTVGGSGIQLYGGYGTDGDIGGTGLFAGNGGASYWGGGIRAARGGPVSTPAAAGSGGGGGYFSGDGSDGMPGIVIIIG